MAVQQNRKTRSRRDMRRSHDALTGPTLAVDATTGVTHRRHHVTADGYYRGKKVIKVIEDAAEMHGQTYRGKSCGSFGDISTFSFFGNKTITTGEGGMVIAQDGALAERMRTVRGQGQSPTRRYWHEVLGFNYRMTNVVARQDIPIGHKVALKDMNPGDTVIKYGIDMGKVVAPIKAGEHAHVHNIKTKRW